MTPDPIPRPRGLLVVSIPRSATRERFSAQVSMVDDLDAPGRETVHATTRQDVLDLVAGWLDHMTALDGAEFSGLPSP